MNTSVTARRRARFIKTWWPRAKETFGYAVLAGIVVIVLWSL